MMIQCFNHQKYPKNRIEWIIVDDGTDKIEDLVVQISQVKYFKFDTKMTLGKKRNFLNEKAKGEIIIFMDDDDYYPPERISHSVQMLQQNPQALCAGSSIMFIYFNSLNKIFKFGPYGPNHSTAATFAFKKKLLTLTKFDENSSVAEEKFFLKNYTIPFVQLDPVKTILVFSHDHNSFDKKELLKNSDCFITETQMVPSDFVKEPDILDFFLNIVDKLLISYDFGKIENKPDVLKQIAEIKIKREIMNKEHLLKQLENQNKLNQLQNHQTLQNLINEQSLILQQLTLENTTQKDKIHYLENKISQLIQTIIEGKREKKEINDVKEIYNTEINEKRVVFSKNTFSNIKYV
jgi:glycosyltransferase involved in cell wall biosynthesis